LGARERIPSLALAKGSAGSKCGVLRFLVVPERLTLLAVVGRAGALRRRGGQGRPHRRHAPATGGCRPPNLDQTLTLQTQLAKCQRGTSRSSASTAPITSSAVLWPPGAPPLASRSEQRRSWGDGRRSRDACRRAVLASARPSMQVSGKLQIGNARKTAGRSSFPPRTKPLSQQTGAVDLVVDDGHGAVFPIQRSRRGQPLAHVSCTESGAPRPTLTAGQICMANPTPPG
jgi:hypothetical protein